MLAQGLQDLKRARIFGTRSAGAALASDIIPSAQRRWISIPTASYTSSGGRVLEGNGVITGCRGASEPRIARAGRDPVIDAAVRWISQP